MHNYATILIFLCAIFLCMMPRLAISQNALELDGINDYVQTSFPGITGLGARTVEAWIQTTANANPNVGGVQQIITDWGVFASGSRYTFCVLWNSAEEA